MQNWWLDELISSQSDNLKLNEGLKLIQQPCLTTGSLGVYDGFDFAELYQFRKFFCHDSDITITGKEPFPGKMLQSKDNVSLPKDIYELLVQYYNNAYEWKFVIIEDAANSANLEDYIIVLPDVNQYGRIQIETEFFGLTIAFRY